MPQANEPGPELRRSAEHPSHALAYATAVALGARGALIYGPSGSGKSALALALMAFGARLVADDRVMLSLRDGALVAACPPVLSGRIEARFVGLLAAEPAPPVALRLGIDMAVVETERLPPRRETTILGCPLPILHKVESGYFAPAILQHLKGARIA